MYKSFQCVLLLGKAFRKAHILTSCIFKTQQMYHDESPWFGSRITNYSHQHTSCQEQRVKLCLVQSSCFSCSHDFVSIAEIFSSKSIPLTFVSVTVLKIQSSSLVPLQSFSLSPNLIMLVITADWNWTDETTFHCKRLVAEPKGFHWKYSGLSSFYQIQDMAPMWRSKNSWQA